MPMRMSISPAAVRRTVSFCSLAALEPADGFDVERIIHHPLAEGSLVLLGQHGRGDEDRHLLAIFDSLERGPHGEFGFSVSDVAAEQAIHRAGLLHVLLDLLGADDLVGRRLVGKFRLEFFLPFGVGRIGDAQLGGAGGLHVEQFRRHVHDGFGDLGFLFFPDAAAEAGELGMAVKSADVFLDEIDPRGRHVQDGVVGESEGQIFLVLPVLGHRVHAGELGDAMRDVNDVISLLEIEERIDGPRGDYLANPAALLVAVKEFVMPEESAGFARAAEFPNESAVQIADECFDPIAQAGDFSVDQFDEALFLAVVLAEDRDIVRLGDLAQFLDCLLRFGLESLQ